MRCQRGSVILFGTLLFFTWNAILVLLLRARLPDQEAPKDDDNNDMVDKVLRVADMLEKELQIQNKILMQIQNLQPVREKWQKKNLNPPTPHVPVIPVLVMACNRVTVRRCLDKLIQYRPSSKLFPIIVSQDCGHADTADVIRSYGSAVTHLMQPDLTDVAVPPEHQRFQGYYKISRHYRWALKQVFSKHSAVIIVEDDLEVAPDFFEYFRATLPLLQSDPSLWCVSAWNDNGRKGFVDPAGSRLLYRTDFFPGLGWMLLRELWEELEPTWPAAFWDDWMRKPEQRRGRACIRPEISRTLTFGREGVSLGQFYEKYLQYIKLNSDFVPFTQLNLTYLKEDVYKKSFQKEVYDAPAVTFKDVQQGALEGNGPFRLPYSSKESFKVFAQNLGIMNDFKSGVPRTGYRGVVSIFSRGRRVYIAPPPGWTQYDPTWN
ncbi:alpha-1,3-mannosyl-glycoprotein 2-beta-N-acetylglucosaminyltransferase a [Syngnathus acus]|uniref:alpha-1,3-mannosyl-glycoprotein 2-beta-N-acetylglucosaminyltransferase a n=1 Tax=Syngnathus acus TaxID=161584 RepID=UPI001885D98B|nr:alpha-1,3-mannosyl-glycoprotein 2-beta-N-acetylglucosaminyltransferase a [Syngnathus acus]XP_037130726.1 alpha-1,3-mannosyl-glycoprotein 2-beta-N-acetylglucosaminyltransferase a [Syngnathus acus]XP_037130727.1 alpha-1,3-mannosyl-glycoprotein 2-beta-N-acetylglucosaminyltransferase a [Syngnathus acus]